MSAASSSGAAWFTRLEPVAPPDDLPRRPDDPRLGEVAEFWRGGPPELRPGRPVLIGFPQDEGVRRNGGRPGAAEAPREIRRWLYRLVPWDCETDTDLAALGLLDLGTCGSRASLEETQAALGEVVGAVLRSGAVPIVLGGGHETAYGHYLGYVDAGIPVGIVNIDAHLDVRPLIDGKGHSGSPFRQAMEHPTHPLPGERYVCLGVQPHFLSQAHWQYVRERWCRVYRASEVAITLKSFVGGARDDFSTSDCRPLSHHRCGRGSRPDVPGVSAPNVTGLLGEEVLEAAARPANCRE